MPDPRVSRLAKVLIHYLLELKPGQQMVLRTNPLADELNLAVYAEAIKAGAHVFIVNAIPGAQEAFYKNASEAQLDYVSPITRMVYETFDAMLVIGAEFNTRELSGINRSPKPIQIYPWQI